MEKTQTSLDRDLIVSRWKVFRDDPDVEDTRDPNAPDWWTDDDEASTSSLTAIGIDLAAMDAAILAQAREQGAGS